MPPPPFSSLPHDEPDLILGKFANLEAPVERASKVDGAIPKPTAVLNEGGQPNLSVDAPTVLPPI